MRGLRCPLAVFAVSARTGRALPAPSRLCVAPERHRANAKVGPAGCGETADGPNRGH